MNTFKRRWCDIDLLNRLFFWSIPLDIAMCKVSCYLKWATRRNRFSGKFGIWTFHRLIFPASYFSSHSTQCSLHAVHLHMMRNKALFYLRISSTFFGCVEHLQCRLGKGLGLVQDVHLLLVVHVLRGQSHWSHDEWLKVASQLTHLWEDRN